MGEFKVAKLGKDPNNSELLRVLNEMFDENITITARSVVKRHMLLNNASDITRNTKRRELLHNWQRKQENLRKQSSGLEKQTIEDLVRILSAKEISLAEIEAQKQALIVSHVQMIRVVAAMGGMKKMREFYETYRTIRNQLVKTGALSEGILKNMNSDKD